MAVNVINNLEDQGHPLIGEIFSVLRSTEAQRDRGRFVAQMRLLGICLAYEIAGTLEGAPIEVTTPLGRRELLRFASDPVLGVLLRAALPLWEGFREVFPRSESMIIGAARREGSRTDDSLEMAVDFTYEGLVPLGGRPLIWIDPMLATGSTLIGVHRILTARGQRPSRTIFAGAIAYRGAIARLAEAIPGIEIHVGSVDETLDERGYIVPGLGDAGDLAFGAKI